MSVIFFSIVSANYVPFARVLMASVREHHPDALRFVVIADQGYRPGPDDAALFTAIPADQLPVPHFHHFAFRYSILEFNTALKPYALAWLAVRHPMAHVAYLDPDILVLSPLTAVISHLDAGALAVITPHLDAPIDDCGHPSELEVMRSGAYNLGFFACGAHTRRLQLASWWCDKLEFGAFDAKELGLFTDQKWVDLLPGMFPDVVVFRHPGYNLAYWNLPVRRLSTAPTGELLAEGQPVSFVHFSGMVLDDPLRFSKHQDRYSAASIGALKPVYWRYLHLLVENGLSNKPPEYAFGRLADGTTVTPDMRVEFRRWFDIGRDCECLEPFALTRADFTARASRRRRIRWASPRSAAVEAYKRLRAGGLVRVVDERLIPKGTARRDRIKQIMRVPSPQRRSAAYGAHGSPRDLPLATLGGVDWGVAQHARANMIGYLTGEFGVAESARLMAIAALSRGVELSLIRVEAGAKREEDLRLAGALTQEAPHPVSIYVINADQIAHVMRALGKSIVDRHYSIGYWAWELARFPPAWGLSVDLVDEIWTPSRFVASSVRGITNKSVRVIRLPVEASPSREYSRAEFGLPDGPFLFLFSFDFHSFVERKNPVGVIDAFRMAFPSSADVALVIKSTNGDPRSDEYRRVSGAAAADSRIILLDGYLSRDQVYGLQSVADAYVSLHRSEGLGLGMAESMSLGKPVIATAYSGNLEFMEPDNSFLVGYRLTDVGPADYVFPDGQVWAEPDLGHAAELMRLVVRDRELASEVGRRARAHMLGEFSSAILGDAFREALTDVYRDHDPFGSFGLGIGTKRAPSPPRG